MFRLSLIPRDQDLWGWAGGRNRLWPLGLAKQKDELGTGILQKETKITKRRWNREIRRIRERRNRIGRTCHTARSALTLREPQRGSDCKAQGCEPASYPGCPAGRVINPNGVV